MTVRTYVDDARSRVSAQREAAAARRDGYEAFLDSLEAVQTVQQAAQPGGLAADGGAPTAHGATTGQAGAPPTARAATSAGGVSERDTTTDGCAAVRSAFAETVGPHADTDAESVLETLQTELSESVALALAPTTEVSYTPAVERAVVSAATRRQSETAALCRALDRESDRLAAAAETVTAVIDWLTDADQTRLPDLGFDALRRHHETLGDHREQCSELARTRQSFLRDTTSAGVDAGVRHRDLVESLYDDFAVDYPVLATAATLDDTCRDCRRTVRRHLVRRV